MDQTAPDRISIDQISIDRISPTRRPGGRARGYQKWRDLLFLHWPVAQEDLLPLIPEGLTIDCHDGQAYVGVVPFAMLDVRPAWLPRRLGFDFLETNVRTYVHAGGTDPGVYFFSLEAASYLAVRAARLRWGLPYFYARMSLERGEDWFDYRTERLDSTVGPGAFRGAASESAPDAVRHRPRSHYRYRVGRELGPSQPDTLEHFLFERYLLHVSRHGQLYTGQVHHTPYPVHVAEVAECRDQLCAAAGLPAPDGPPPLVHYSPGVDVEIFPLAKRKG